MPKIAFIGAGSFGFTPGWSRHPHVPALAASELASWTSTRSGWTSPRRR